VNNFQELAIEEALRSELGKGAKFWRYGREHRTPLTFVLEEVERQIGPRFYVYWVEGGPPEVFCLPGFSPSPVVFSTRYLSLTAFVRNLLVKDSQKEILPYLAERTCLKIMAEMALRCGDPDYAVMAFIKSVSGSGVWFQDYDKVVELEHGPVSEAYMATWFYGMVHEIGHVHPLEVRSADEPLFSDDWMIDGITSVLDNFKTYPDWLKHLAVERAKQERSTSVLGIDQVRGEGLADIFATSVLFKSTADIMYELHQKNPIQKQFKVERFVQEMNIFLNIITFIERCRRVALISSATGSARSADREALIEHALQPVSLMVRSLMQRCYLDAAVASALYGPGCTVEQLAHVTKTVNDLNGQHAEKIDEVENGLARAMEFSFYPEKREDAWALIETFRKELPNSGPARLEAKRFCEMADAFGADGKLLWALKEIVSLSESTGPGPERGRVYYVPWVEGPDDYSRPLGLDTKYGHLIFAFREEVGILDTFCGLAALAMLPGFTLSKAALKTWDDKRLGLELAAYMPGGFVFKMVFEGTENFTKCLKELEEGTIWGVEPNTTLASEEQGRTGSNNQ
jgi:hypothetical protein